MTIFQNNLRRIFGRPINIVLMLVVPIALNIFFIAVSTSETKYVVGVIDYDQSKLSEMILNQLDGEADITQIDDDEAGIKSELLNSNIDMALKIEKGYADDIIAGKDAKVQTYAITETNQSEPIRILISGITSAAQELGRQCGGDSDQFYTAMDDYLNGHFTADYESFSFTSQETTNRAVSSLGYLAMGMMFLMTFATTLLLEDKESGVFARIATTPVTRGSYLVQHLMSYITVAIVQIIMIFMIVPNVVEISYGSTTKIELQTMFITLLFAGVCIAIGITVSRFAKNEAMVSAIISLIDFPVLMLGGCLWPTEIMPDFLQKAGKFMPTRWFLDAAETVLNGEGLRNAEKNIAFMVILMAVLLIVSFAVKTDDN